MESLGDCNYFRASDVEFCNINKKWMVCLIPPWGEYNKSYYFSTRQEALDWERRYIEKRMGLLVP